MLSLFMKSGQAQPDARVGFVEARIGSQLAGCIPDRGGRTCRMQPFLPHPLLQVPTVISHQIASKGRQLVDSFAYITSHA